MTDKQQLRTWLADHKISEVEAIIPYQAGIARGKFMPAKTFGAQGGMRLPESVFIQTVTGEHPEETVFSPTDRDMLAEQDLSTIRVVPWANGSDTDYRSGQEFHFDYTIGKKFGNLTLGLGGYYYKRRPTTSSRTRKWDRTGTRGRCLPSVRRSNMTIKTCSFS